MKRRQALSVLETVVALAILAFSVAAMMNFNTSETRAIEMSEERLTAIMLLGEIQQTLNNRDYDFYKNFPKDPKDFDDVLHREEVVRPPVFDEKDTTLDTEFAKELRKTIAKMGLKRYMLFEAFTDADGREGGVVTYLVTYKSRKGGTKEVSTFEIVYKPPTT